MGWIGRAGSLALPSAPLRGYPADSSVRDITTARRFLEAGESIRRRIRILVALAQTVAAKQKDLRVLDKPIGNGGSDGRIKEDVAPVGKRSIRCDDRTSFATVARRDDLIKKIRRVLIQGQIP